MTKRIIPCLDVKDGRVVKGVRFVSLRDAGDPVEVAEAYDRQGADELCFLDITASHEQRGTILDLVAQVADRLQSRGLEAKRSVDTNMPGGRAVGALVRYQCEDARIASVRTECEIRLGQQLPGGLP